MQTTKFYGKIFIELIFPIAKNIITLNCDEMHRTSTAPTERVYLLLYFKCVCVCCYSKHASVRWISMQFNVIENFAFNGVLPHLIYFQRTKP